MSFSPSISRRKFIQSASLVTAGVVAPSIWLPRTLRSAPTPDPLAEFGYGNVAVHSDLHETQLEQAHSVLMEQRRWKTGDRVEVDLPITARLEPIHPRHPQTVALLFGPLVLFCDYKRAASAHPFTAVGSKESRTAELASRDRQWTDHPLTVYCY